MTSNALFAPSGGRNQRKNLVEFKAGKMLMSGKKARPDLRKGMIYLNQSEDGLMHFCWKERSSSTTEDDFIIFPEDCVFKAVSKCTTGRVFVLKFKSSTRRFLYWLQDLKPDKDEENCRRVNELLNNPPPARSNHDSDLQNLLNTMSQQQLMQLFGGFSSPSGLSSLLSSNRPSSSRSSTGSTSTTRQSSSTKGSSKPASASSTATTTTSTASTGSPSASHSIQLKDLQNVLSDLKMADKGGNAQQGSSASGILASNSANTELDDSVITSQALENVSNNGDALKKLQKYLPASTATEEEMIRTVLTSDEFKKELRALCVQLAASSTSDSAVGKEPAIDAEMGNFVKLLNASRKEQPAKSSEKRKSSDEDSGTEAKRKDKKDEDKAAE